MQEGRLQNASLKIVVINIGLTGKPSNLRHGHPRMSTLRTWLVFPEDIGLPDVQVWSSHVRAFEDWHTYRYTYIQTNKQSRLKLYSLYHAASRVKKAEHLYSALHGLRPLLSAQAWITQFYLQQTPCLLYLVSVHQMAPPPIEVANI